MKRLKISEPASHELTEAVAWYEERRRGWGARLFDAVSNALRLIESHPEIGSPRSGSPARQLKVRGFPYIIAYRVRPTQVYVVAVAHTSRRPGFWKDRS